MVGRQLCAVLPIDLIAVVLLGVVEAVTLTPAMAMILPHGKNSTPGVGRRASKGAPDAVSGHDAGGLPGKSLRVVAAVEAHRTPSWPPGLRPFKMTLAKA